jgi:hypothetical protein
LFQATVLEDAHLDLPPGTTVFDMISRRVMPVTVYGSGLTQVLGFLL